MTNLAKETLPEKEPRIWAAPYDAQKDAFRVAMQDGRIYLLKRPIPEDDGSEILELFLEGGGEVFTVVQATGNEFSVPWDVIHNLADGSQSKGKENVGKRIGQRIRALRKSAGLTQERLAQMTGLQRPNISRIETGSHLPSILLLQRLAEALQATVADLIAE